ncbi:TadE/TadG family type IV pilus assembly protein [Vibrio comitans]|uniref:TadE-like domain-containing protein n=1 Tax=Vibrio comitans NBRC 102076 TaxID=1219078 RepID=A0A4Y3IQA1_9VIBR|nr:TadE family protein [Vibrio comitans]GEA61699.1 hypothetical protein VCO01S_28920 [Vibrio comitans NBRC 102076]
MRVKKNKGLAAIEMLFVLPILLFLLGGIVELGRIFIHYTVLNKALQNSARSAVSETYGTERLSAIAADDYIQEFVVYGGQLGTDRTTILPGLKEDDISIDTSDTNYVKISANYKYSPIFTSIPIIGGDFEITMNASSLMRTTQ